MAKVLHIIPSVSPIRGGTSVAVIEIVQALRNCQVEAEILTTNDSGPGVLEIPCGEFIDYQDVPVLFFPRWSPSVPALSEYAISRQLMQWLNAYIKGYDLVHIHSLFSYVCTFGARKARQKSIPYVISPHGHFSPWVINQKRLKKNIYNFLLENANLKKASLIHCTTRLEQKYVGDFGIDAPTVNIPLGIHFPTAYPNAKIALRDKYNISVGIETPIILFLSRIHPKKQLDFLLKVLANIQGENNFHLVIGGSGEPAYCQYIEGIISSLGLGEKVTFTGFVSGEDKQLLLYGCDFLALPSLGENFGIAVAEAMAAGLPVVITPEVEIAVDVIEENAGLVVPGTLDQWESALKQLINTPDIRREMGNNGQNLSRQRYNWNVIGPQFVEAYNSICQP
ncbi:glycosyltransferase [Limnospira fusiformis]|uniref:glycosyltransferase n=1 Tax=Limnospira fusiformis TaxID=54297 RepID=UPI001449132C|nr:glycosyltransferase [Limnospira fusiformis SAG 85.79]